MRRTQSSQPSPAEFEAKEHRRGRAEVLAFTQAVETYMKPHRKGAKGEITLRNVAVLMTLADRKFQTKDLAQHMQLSKPVISRGMTTLERFKLAKRRENVADKRSPHLELTKGGVEFVNYVCAAMKATPLEQQKAA